MRRLKMQVTEILNNYEFFHNSEAGTQEIVTKHARLLHIPSGEIISHDSQLCSRLLLLGDGSLRVYLNGESGREVTLYHVRAGEVCIINILSAITNAPLNVTAVVTRPIVAVALNIEDVRNIANISESLNNFFYRIMTQRLEQILSLIEQITFTRMEHRLAAFLIKQFTNEGNQCQVISTTHADIAAELGSAREVISRHLKEFSMMGAIEIGRGKLRLLDENILRQNIPSLESIM